MGSVGVDVGTGVDVEGFSVGASVGAGEDTGVTAGGSVIGVSTEVGEEAGVAVGVSSLEEVQAIRSNRADRTMADRR